MEYHMSISIPIYNLGSSAISNNLTSEISPLRGRDGIQDQGDTASFDNLLGKSMTLLNETQLVSDAATQSLIMGDSENLHDVMIKATEAQLALDLAVQVRNKSLEAFNEIKNMQF